MPSDSQGISSEAAQASLEQYDAARRTGGNRGAPPLWFIILTAFWIGAMVALLGDAEKHRLVGLMALLSMVMTASMRRRMGAWLGHGHGLAIRIVGVLVFGGLAIASLMGGSGGRADIPLLAGAASAIATVVFFWLKKSRIEDRA